MAASSRSTRHFDFGRNWASYAGTIDPNAVKAAENGLDRMDLGAIAGKTFLDIGCGSGIHSLAAARRGAQVTSIDIDPDSVSTTEAVLRDHDVTSHVEQRSVFEAGDLGAFDIVYSWGVLHHTGDVWGALDAAAARVKPEGTLAIALYERTPLCGAWGVIKRVYSKAPKWMRAPARLAFGVTVLSYASARQRVGPVRYIRQYRRDRGMSFWHDIDDWLGGYPYQATRAEDVVAFFKRRGMTLIQLRKAPPQIGVFGTGCSEFVFKGSA